MRRVDRDAAIEKVRRLANVTVERGCAPAEEDKAIRAGIRLVDEFGITYTEIVGEPEIPSSSWYGVTVAYDKASGQGLVVWPDGTVAQVR